MHGVVEEARVEARGAVAEAGRLGAGGHGEEAGACGGAVGEGEAEG